MRNGIDASKVTRRMAGESARRKGLAMRSSDVRSSTDDVEWISLGRSTSLRAVMRDKTRGMSENSRKLIVRQLIMSRPIPVEPLTRLFLPM